MPRMNSTLAQEAKANLDAARAAHVEATKTMNAERSKVQAKAAEDADFRAKLFDVNSDEFKAFDVISRQVSEAEGVVHAAEKAWQAHVEIEGAAAASNGVQAINAAPSGNDLAEAMARVQAMMPQTPMSLIARAAKAVVEGEEYKNLVATGRLGNTQMKIGEETIAKSMMSRDEFKALLTGAGATSGGAFIVPQRVGFVGMPVRELNVLDLITVGYTDSDTVEWVKQTARPTAAAEHAEATDLLGTGAAPESSAAFEVVEQSVKDIGHWIPATRNALSDAGQLRTLIESQMEYGVVERVENQVIGGDGTGQNLTGIESASDTLSYSRDTGNDESRLDALHKGITLVRLQNIEPTDIGLNPEVWQAVRLEKNGNGDYVLGPPNTATPDTVWGKPIHTNAAYDSDVSIVGHYRRAFTLWIREDPSLYVSDSHGEFFTSRILALLCIGRFAFGVTEPKAVCIVDTMVAD